MKQNFKIVQYENRFGNLCLYTFKIKGENKKLCENNELPPSARDPIGHISITGFSDLYLAEWDHP